MVQEVWGSIPKPVNWSHCRQQLATAATFLRSCVAQALRHGDEAHTLWHNAASYIDYLIFLLWHGSSDSFVLKRTEEKIV